MRVETTGAGKRAVARWKDDEDGASAAFVVVITFMLLAVAMLAVDGGFLYVSQRGQVADTDSSAISAARELADDPCATQADVNARADQLIAANDARSARVGDVDIDPATACVQRRVVTVTTRRDAPRIFAGVFGFDASPTAVTSAAVMGPSDIVEGVRPIAICAEDPHLRDEYGPFIEWDRNGQPKTDYVSAMAATDVEYSAYASPEAQDAHPSVGPDGEDYAGFNREVHRLVFERLAGTNDCGSAPGGFGWVDFNGAENPNGNATLRDRIIDGYEGDVSLGPSADPAVDDEDCDASDDDVSDVNCPPKTGAHGASTQGALDVVKCDVATPAHECEHVMPVVVYTDVIGTGANARFNISRLAVIVLRGHSVGTGQLGGSNYFDFEYVDEILSGTVAGSVPADYTGTLSVNLCGAGTFRNC